MRVAPYRKITFDWLKTPVHILTLVRLPVALFSCLLVCSVFLCLFALFSFCLNVCTFSLVRRFVSSKVADVRFLCQGFIVSQICSSVRSETRIGQYSSVGFAHAPIPRNRWKREHTTFCGSVLKIAERGLTRLEVPCLLTPFPRFTFQEAQVTVRSWEGLGGLAPGATSNPGGGRAGGGGGACLGLNCVAGARVHTVDLAGRHPTPLRPKQSSYPARHT